MSVAPIHTSQWGGDIARAVVFAILAIGLVILRFISRRITRTDHDWDDWLALVALVSYLAVLGFGLWGTIVGGSIDPTEVPVQNIVSYLQSVYVTIIVAIFNFTASKLSVLYFYKRIFGAKRSFMISVWITVGLCMLWFIIGEFVYAFQCSPVQKAWEPLLPGKCFDFSSFVIGIEVPNALIDFIMVALPINAIRQLHLPLRYKVSIGGIFFLGALVGIVGLVRIAIIYRPGQVDLHLLGALNAFQLLLTIFCACLPVCRPLLPRRTMVFGSLSGFGTSFKGLAGNVTRRFKGASPALSDVGEDASRKSTQHSRKYGQGVSDDTIPMVLLDNTQHAQISKVSVGSTPELGTPAQGEIVVKKGFEVTHAM